MLKRAREKAERLVVVLFSGRPLIVTDEIRQADAFVAAWLPGSEGGGVVDALVGRVPFSGSLPVICREPLPWLIKDPAGGRRSKSIRAVHWHRV